jgi:alkylhydroperoxidase family enzyme
VILRAAFVRRSRYEWHQHVRIALAAGLTDEEIAGVQKWRESTLFSDDERALLAFVDDLDRGRPGDETFTAVSRGRTAGEVFGVLYLITLYFQLAQVMEALDLETEEPFVGW